MSAAEFSALLLLFAAATFTPGPNTTLSTALAANRGLRGSMHFVCAVPVGWGLLFVACALGVGALVVALPALRWAVLALTAVAGWVLGHADWVTRLGWTGVLMVVFGLASNFTYALVGSLLRGWLAQGRRLLWFNRAMALALVATAGWMAWSALQAGVAS